MRLKYTKSISYSGRDYREGYSGMSNSQSLIILERPEQAAMLMKKYSHYKHDVFPIDYNARVFLKEYQGKILSLIDFFDNEGHRYALEKTDNKINETIKADHEKDIFIIRRYLSRFYYSYYFMLEYIIARVVEIYDQVLFYRDSFKIGEDIQKSPLEEILGRSGIKYTLIEDIRSEPTINKSCFIMNILNHWVNGFISYSYGKNKPILFSNTAYNLLKIVRSETAKHIIEMCLVDRYTLRRFLGQLFIFFRSTVCKNSYRYPDARLYIVPSQDFVVEPTDNYSNYLTKMKSTRDDLVSLVKKLNPVYYVSQNAINFYLFLNGEIKRNSIKCKTLMIPHGANLLPDSETSNLEEKYIAEMNVDNDFDFTFIQSAFMRDYVERQKLKGQFKYGNKIWGKAFGSFHSIKFNGNKINVLYAASSFGHPGSLRFNNWLLHDELVRDIKAILGVISPDEFSLHIKLRENVKPQLLIDELKGYTGWEIIDVPFNFTEIMKNFDVFMTFRTTAIEEALYINKPVIIIDYTGRYKPIPADNETVYYVTHENLHMLPDLLRFAKSVKPEAFRKYRVIEEPLFDE